MAAEEVLVDVILVAAETRTDKCLGQLALNAAVNAKCHLNRWAAGRCFAVTVLVIKRALVRADQKVLADPDSRTNKCMRQCARRVAINAKCLFGQ